MNRTGLVIAFSIVLGVSACSEQPTEIVVGQSVEDSTTTSNERETSTTEEVPTTFAPTDTSRTTEMGRPEPKEPLAPDQMPPIEPDPSDRPGAEPAEREDQEWRSHDLAALVITPERLGASWEIDNIDITEPEPGDEDELVCGVPEPPTLDGLEVELVGYETGADSPEQELLQLIGRGTPADAQAWIDAFTDLGGCDGSDDEYDPTSATLADVSIEGSDSVVGIDLTVGDETNPEYIRFVGARFGDIVVIVGHAAESRDELKTFDWLQDQVSWSGAQIDS